MKLRGNHIEVWMGEWNNGIILICETVNRMEEQNEKNVWWNELVNEMNWWMKWIGEWNELEMKLIGEWTALVNEMNWWT